MKIREFSMRKHFLIFTTTLTLASFISCTHEPFLSAEDPNNPDNQPVDMERVDFVINTKACDPGTVYFENQILPIFISNCAISGCHDAQSAEDGVVLTNYNNITKKIKPGDPNDSEYYTVLNKTGEDLMPRDPSTGRGYSLPSDKINLIKSWITQGAKNNYCDECDTTVYTYSGTIKAIIDQNCATSSACHGNGSQYGALTTYAGVKARVDNQLIQKRAVVNQDMPPAGSMPDCDRLLIKNWIDAGAQNN